MAWKCRRRGKLKPEQIEMLTRWVKAGLPMKDGVATAGQSGPKGGVITPSRRNYWAYKPVKRPAVPMVKNAAWVANPIDAFVLAKLESEGAAAAAPADRVALARRVYYDLTGLPPTPEEVDAFVNDRSPDAYEQADRSAARVAALRREMGPALARCGSLCRDNGYERDGPKPFVWRYRDYVIRTLQRRQAVRPVRARATRRRRDARLQPGRDHCHRLLSAGSLGRRTGRSLAGNASTNTTTSWRPPARRFSA